MLLEERAVMIADHVEKSREQVVQDARKLEYEVNAPAKHARGGKEKGSW